MEVLAQRFVENQKNSFVLRQRGADIFTDHSHQLLRPLNDAGEDILLTPDCVNAIVVYIQTVVHAGVPGDGVQAFEGIGSNEGGGKGISRNNPSEGVQGGTNDALQDDVTNPRYTCHASLATAIRET